MTSLKEYIGDSVYADFDGHGITLTTENGYGPSNTIYLEFEVLCALKQYEFEVFQRAEDERKAVATEGSAS